MGEMYLSELFKIVEGANRLDSTKVNNYAALLADKLESSGEAPSARRLRKILTKANNELRPAYIDQHRSIPVDSESRFPLLENVKVSGKSESYLPTLAAQESINDFVATVERREQLINRGINADCTLLLYGPPGCGKTHLAEAIADKLNLPLYLARLDGIISSYLGNTAKNIRAIFEHVSKSPCILFLDEFDAIAKVRDDGQEIGELKRVVNSFIQTLDLYSKDLILIAATNHEQLLDSAIWRRFNQTLHLELPTIQQRRVLWEKFSNEITWTTKEIDVLSDLSEGFSSSDIKTTCNQVLRRWITQGEQWSLKTTVQTLLRLSQNNCSKFRISDLDNAKELHKKLQAHNPKLYTQQIVGELTGVSRSTLSRMLEPTPKPKGRKTRKTAIRV